MGMYLQGIMGINLYVFVRYVGLYSWEGLRLASSPGSLLIKHGRKREPGLHCTSSITYITLQKVL